MSFEAPEAIRGNLVHRDRFLHQQISSLSALRAEGGVIGLIVRSQSLTREREQHGIASWAGILEALSHMVRKFYTETNTTTHR